MKQDIHYIVGVPIYDEDNQLWEVKIGLNDKKMTLLFSVWGTSDTDSLTKANQLMIFLERNSF